MMGIEIQKLREEYEEEYQRKEQERKGGIPLEVVLPVLEMLQPFPVAYMSAACHTPVRVGKDPRRVPEADVRRTGTQTDDPDHPAQARRG